jgi:hypothetical protein
MARVRASDRSIAHNLFYGHPRQPSEPGYEAGYAPGGWSLREWTARDLDQSYDLPPRWGHIIIGALDDFRSKPGLRRYEYRPGTAEEKAFAKYIAAVRESSEPERVPRKLTKHARTR